MISFLRGKIILKREKFIILDVNGVGYKVFLSQKTLHKISQKTDDLKLFCYLSVRERALDVYGFLDQEALESFETLIDISSIGPKAALEISSLGTIEKIKKSLEEEDEKLIKKIFNIGRKKAQIIILELSRKIKTPLKKEPISEDEAFQVLLGLGFSRQKIKDALIKIPNDIENEERKIKEALKILGKRLK